MELFSSKKFLMLYYVNKFLSNSKVQAVILGIIGLATISMLVSYKLDDPSFNSATTGYTNNLLGIFGSYLSDFLYQFFGVAAFIIPISCFIWGKNCWQQKYRKSFIRISVMLLALFSTAALLSNFDLEFVPSNGGGAAGIIIFHFLKQFTNQLHLLLLFFIHFTHTHWAFLVVLINNTINSYKKNETKKITQFKNRKRM